MNWGGIIGVVILIIIVYYILSYLFGGDDELLKVRKADKAFVVPVKKLPKNTGSNATYVIWFYIGDWRTGNAKKVLSQGNGGGPGAGNFSITL